MVTWVAIILFQLFTDQNHCLSYKTGQTWDKNNFFIGSKFKILIFLLRQPILTSDRSFFAYFYGAFWASIGLSLHGNLKVYLH